MEKPPPSSGRDETELERVDRNLLEIIQEVRVVQTGVQVLFAFLLSAVFQQRFTTLSSFQRVVYFGTLLASGGAVILLTAPSSYHRILFRQGDKRHLVAFANRLTMLGLASMGLAMVGVLTLVSDVMWGTPATIVVGITAGAGVTTVWYVIPVARRRTLDRLRRRPAMSAAGESARPRSGSGARTRP